MYFKFACRGEKNNDELFEDHRCWTALAGEAEFLQAVSKLSAC